MNDFFINAMRYEKPTVDDWGGMLIELTNYCNLNCSFCLNNSSNKQNLHLSLDDFKIIIDKIKHKNITVQLSGGEPLTNPYFKQMLDYLISEDMSFHINTNGTLVDDELISCIKGYSKSSIQMSLDGASADTDDHLRCKGHFDKVLSVMRAFEGASFKRGVIKMVINRLNCSEIEENFKLALQHGFVPTYSFLVRSGRAQNNWDELCLSDRERYTVRNRIWTLLDNNVKYFERFKSPNVLQYLRNMNINYIGECQFNLECNHFTPCIRPDGSAQPCQGLFDEEFCIGNILYEDPDYLFSHQNKQVVLLSKRVKERRNLLDNYHCKSCPINKVCGKGCVAESYNAGDFYGKPADCHFRIRDYIQRKVGLE